MDLIQVNKQTPPLLLGLRYRTLGHHIHCTYTKVSIKETHKIAKEKIRGITYGWVPFCGK